ncbi:MAG TPA: hypothetical protein VF734_07065 [Pseudonocardiaceae bacterium]
MSPHRTISITHAAAVEDVAFGGSPWMAMRWFADGFLSQRTVIATLP